MKPFFITIPHAGEQIPDEAFWLKGLPQTLLMCDVDRYVDQLYRPAAESLGIKSIIADVHRYVVDLNRVPEDIDANSVEGSAKPAGKFTTGYHWSQTTTEALLMKSPMSRSLHEQITQKYFKPFHKNIVEAFQQFKEKGGQDIYHLDAHSMPSRGTAAHRDPGEVRPEIVVSDCDGESCNSFFKDCVIKAYTSAGFEVSYNWPYKGGRITETYGQPAKGQHTLQVEMNRSLYMDEMTKQKDPKKFTDLQNRVFKALAYVAEGLR